MKIKQLASNITELELNNGTKVLFSYDTPVVATKSANLSGYDNDVLDKIIITGQKYSITTTKHINKWIKSQYTGKRILNNTIIVDQSIIDELVK